MERVNSMKRSYEGALSYRKNVVDGKPRRNYGRLATIETSEAYVVCDGITFTMNNMSQIDDVGVHRSAVASFSSVLVVMFDVTTTEIILALVLKVTTK